MYAEAASTAVLTTLISPPSLTGLRLACPVRISTMAAGNTAMCITSTACSTYAVKFLSYTLSCAYWPRRQSNQTWQALRSRSDPPQRPFVLTRSFFAGSQRFGAMWTGDNLGTWEHMAVGVKMVLALNLGGFSFAGCNNFVVPRVLFVTNTSMRS